MKPFFFIFYFVVGIVANDVFGQQQIVINSTGYTPIVLTASDNYITKEYPGLTGFDEIKLVGSPDIQFTRSNDGSYAVSAYGSDNVIDYLEIDVKGRTLIVKMRDNLSITGKPKLKVTITAPQLASVASCGSGDIDIDGNLKGDQIDLSVTGSGNIECSGVTCNKLNVKVIGSGNVDVSKINTNKIDAQVSGSGDVELKGKTTMASFSVAGSGDIDAEDLQATNVESSVAGSGDVSCRAEKTLHTDVKGSGNIIYKGNPELKDSSNKRNSVKRSS